ncbi:MAG TPA: hypothetical protein VLY45_07335 [Nitrospiria bacterium]|nr:hypothetical protein [Nitrospiria bacterium]
MRKKRVIRRRRSTATATRRPRTRPAKARKAPAAEERVDPFRLDRGQRMLEVGSHLISYYMFLAHQLQPLTGETGPFAGPANAPDRFKGQFNEVRRALLRVVGHHPVLRGKIERLASETERMLGEGKRFSSDHPNRLMVQQEAKALSQRLRESSRAMSDLVAILRNV